MATKSLTRLYMKFRENYNVELQTFKSPKKEYKSKHNRTVSIFFLY